MSSDEQSYSPTLSPARLFSSPSLTGNPPTDLRFSPDGEFVTFRAPATDDKERFDLFRMDIQSGKCSVWVDARDVTEITSDVTELTSAERAERERRRDFSHGITQYEWRPHHPHQLLLPINGQAYLLDTSTSEPPIALCAEQTRQSAFQFSADGNRLSFVRDRNLFVLDIATATTEQLTRASSNEETYGLPDFLAAEEMHRFKGHWWDRGNTGVFFTRVDESEVETSYRLELDSQGARTIEQRYPFAGKTNPLVELRHVDLTSTTTTLLWQSNAQEEYLARVLPVSNGVVVVVQDRRQQQLRYLWQDNDAPFGLDRWHEIFCETSATWTNLTDDLRQFHNKLLTTDEVDGHRQALLLDFDGTTKRLNGPTHINRIVGSTNSVIFVCGWQDSPLENHLYQLEPGKKNSVRQLTMGTDWHEATLNQNCSAFIDSRTSLDTMLAISHVRLPELACQELYLENVNDHAHPYHPFVQHHAVATLGSLPADDGQDLYYRLTPPSDVCGKHPVVVYVYGGPGVQKVKSDWGTLTVQLFAQNGFAVLELDNRGSANRGRTFEAPLYKNMGNVEVVDQLLGLKVLEDIAWIDSNRVGIFGHSYGGYMALMCLSQAPDKFAAGVAIAPVCDWQLYDSHYTERFMGLPEENEEAYQRGNVLSHLSNLNSPLLLMHGMADDNVLFQNSTKIMARLQELGKTFQLMTYPGAKHSMQEPHVSVHRFNMILSFFREHLAAEPSLRATLTRY